MKSVFISSTRVDLIEHRAAVDSAIRRLEQRPINMDDFGSQPGGASGTSVREVDKGDIYIGILAHRYGYVPAGMDRSVTEQEYDRAVERRMPRLMYLVDPAYAWPEEFIEKDDPTAGYSAQDKLNQFKAKVNKAEVRSLFTTPDDLAEKVAIDLTKLLAEDRQQQRLFRVISAAVIVIIALIAAFISIPDVKNRVVEIAGVASPTSTHTPTPTFTYTPSPTFTPSPTPTATATPLEGTPFAQGDVGVVFADFDVIDANAPHTERNIERALQNESVPFIHVRHTLSGRAEAQQIARQYNATIVIWGDVALGGVSLSFEINAPSTSVETTISGLQVSATQLDNFSAYVFQGMDVLYIVDFIRGQVAYFANDDTSALTLFNSAVERIPAGREKDVHAEALHFYRGNVYYAQKDYAHALDDYAQAIRIAPAETAFYANRASVYDTQQDYAHALADYTEVIRLNPTDAQSYFVRGIIYRHQQDYAHALADYTEAIRLNPNLEAAYIDRGIVYQAIQDNDSALADFNQAIQLDPNDIQAYRAQGSFYFSQRDFVHALEAFSRAVEIAPNNEKVYLDRGGLYFGMQDYPHAVADFSQAIRVNPQSALGYKSRAVAYDYQNDSAHALDDYTQAILLDPSDVDSYLNRGVIYYAQSDTVRALADFNQVIRLDPTNAQAYFNRAAIYYNQQDDDHALIDINQSIQLDPTNPDAYAYRGTIYDDQEDYPHAIEDFTQVIQLDPTNTSAYYRRGVDYLSLTSTETDTTKVAEITQLGITDLRYAQSLGLTLSDNLESILTELEAQLATPEATDMPTS